MEERETVSNQRRADCIICVSSEDILGLFGLSLSCCVERLRFVDKIIIVTPNPDAVHERLSSLPVGKDALNRISVFADSEILSKKELSMCGWSRQQIIKLRAHRLSTKRHILSVGSDTIILREMEWEHFNRNGIQIIRRRPHISQDNHIKFERERCRNILKLLEIDIEKNQDLIADYIFDVFMFEREALTKLDSYLSYKFKDEYTARIFPQTVNGYLDMSLIGEWSLYSIFLIRILQSRHVIEDDSGFVRQIHSQREFESYEYDGYAAHFVRKDFDFDLITREMRARGLMPKNAERMVRS